MENIEILSDALAGKHGPRAQATAEVAVKKAVGKIADMLGGAIGGTFAERPKVAQKFASGGVVKRGGPFIMGNDDREHVMPLPAGGIVVNGQAWRPVDMPEPERVVVINCEPYTGSVRIKGVVDDPD